jgi:hypothetical protein
VGTYLPIDDNIKFHKYLGWVIAVLTSIHCLSHAVNFYNIGYEADVNALASVGLLPRGAEPKNPWYEKFNLFESPQKYVGSRFRVV